jgi:transposase
MNKKFIVDLTDEERNQLQEIVKKGKGPAYRIKHAYILLNADENGPNMADKEISVSLHCHLNTIHNVRKRFVEFGLNTALDRKPLEYPSRPKKLDGEQEARLIAIACGKPPEGRKRWTMSLLADELVALDIVDTISPKTVERTLKKNELKPHLRQCWVIPPEQNEEFVAHMEDVLGLYQCPYDEKNPVVCMDEQPFQFVSEVVQPISATENHPERYDYEYRRNGSLNVFMFTEPLAGWRKVIITDSKTKKDWAEVIMYLLEVEYSTAEKVILICDNYPTHTIGALYLAFSPEVASRLLKRLEIHYTPKHGSWLNIAEIELSALTVQCIALSLRILVKYDNRRDIL